ncbi:fumarylacetoacetate hydrolase family protein [Leisingera methylohalidivorans]|uniref:5-oxopent-3-ene-1,2,5-tricarboxylate decarboxylase n=1 Tax=Leisingera methylohalidivorans DSM 14336 TaxID=999552 RepID=V9VZA9_9RHOB|nr:fumarylacetoacetate hydrolase family protein [Leisingera methylohalidivorans]AHD02232.1 5-oxopent-3-ene-1,2,5-tricarboxylate decarboxylase [Leisingera methylohalidivorans DSM 14336]
MRLLTYKRDGKQGMALGCGSDWADLGEIDPIDAVTGSAKFHALAQAAKQAPRIDISSVEVLPPIPRPGKIICVGLNYADHTAESPYEQPEYPTLFPRFATSLIPDRAAIIRPRKSHELDFEGELAVVIGKTARHVSPAEALSHVAGYSIFNDASIRDYQFKTPQWTVGKNFDGTGAFGPVLVTADELPEGAAGLAVETRLNGETVQRGNTSDMIYSVADLISIISEAITLEPGDVIATGTPAGIGWARDPKLFMRPGDTVEVEIDQIGLLRNPVADEDAIV